MIFLIQYTSSGWDGLYYCIYYNDQTQRVYILLIWHNAIQVYFQQWFSSRSEQVCLFGSCLGRARTTGCSRTRWTPWTDGTDIQFLSKFYIHYIKIFSYSHIRFLYIVDMTFYKWLLSTPLNLTLTETYKHSLFCFITGLIIPLSLFLRVLLVYPAWREIVVLKVKRWEKQKRLCYSYSAMSHWTNFIDHEWVELSWI